MLKSHLPLVPVLILLLPALLFASWAEDFAYPEGTLFSSESDWSFYRDSDPPENDEEPADNELFEIIPGNSAEISSTHRPFIYKTPFLEKAGGDSVLLVRSGSNRPRAVFTLPESLQIGPGEKLYFSVLTQDFGGNPFGWLAFGDDVEDDPSLGFRQSNTPLKYAARARDPGGFSEQTEGAELEARPDHPNLLVGRISLGKDGSPDRVAILLNPENHQDMDRWQSIAEKNTGLTRISHLWIRKGNVGGETVYDRIRVSRQPEEVLHNRPVAYRPLFGARNLARNLEAPRGLKIRETESGSRYPELWLHKLPEEPDHLTWSVEFSENLQNWNDLSLGDSLKTDEELPDVRGLGHWQQVRHENGSGSLPQRGFYRVRAEVQNESFEDPVTATLKVDETFQTIDGFGGSLAYSAQNITDELADFLFDPNEGLGFSLARIRINFRNTDDDGNVEPNSWEWRAALKAQERGAKVWASPWSANENLKEDASGPDGRHGGRLKDDEYGTYAQNLIDFISWAEAQNINLIAISPQNEPDYRFHNNESMDWEPGELLSFITDDFRPALNAAGYQDMPIVAPELMDWHRKSGWEAFYDHADTDILAFHNYDWAYDFFNSGNDTRYPQPVNTDKPIWLTEISDVFSGEDFTDTIEDALVWAKHIHRVIAETGGTAWHWWWFAPAAHGVNNNETILATRAGVYSGGEPIEGEPEALKRGYGMAQFARFVRPGDQMIAIEYARQEHEQLLLSAYQGRGKVTVVAINEKESPQNLRLEDIPSSLTMTTAWATTAEKNLESQGHMPRRRGEPLEITLPAQSIVTLVFQ